MFHNPTSTICALITPAGKGAVAVIRLSGKDAFLITEKLFFSSNRKKISEAKSHTIHFGVLKSADKIIDEVLISVFRAPNSYTGENVVEISCHGSVFIQQQILKLALSSGAEMAKPGEFTMRAFLNSKLDLVQAESVADIIASENESAHKLAFAQMRGGYSEEIKKLRNELIHFAAMLELELDFAEEDVEFANRDELKKLVAQLNTKVESLYKSFELGNVLKNGVPAVIAGKPNTGKSTLLNVLLNDDRAIVSDIAGTTRDTIEDEMVIEGIRFRFIDTAGIRQTADRIESKGVERTLEKIKNASVVIYLFDPQETSVNELNSIFSGIKDQSSNFKLLPVANKIDKFTESEIISKYSSIKNLVCISAKNKLHIDVLLKALVDFVPVTKINLGEHFVSNARHAQALKHAQQSLKKVVDGLNSSVTNDFIAADIRYALNYLGEITGDVTNDDLLDFIFSKFCIGK